MIKLPCIHLFIHSYIFQLDPLNLMQVHSVSLISCSLILRPSRTLYLPDQKISTMAIHYKPPISKFIYIYISIMHAYIYIILAASSLASSGFAAIGCFGAQPYSGIYILKNYSILTAKKSANHLFLKIQSFFLPKTFP